MRHLLPSLRQIGVIVLAAASLLAGCGDKSSREAAAAASAALPASVPAPAPERIKLRLAWVPDMAEVGVFVAKENGFFAREGLDVTIEPGGFGLDPIKLVATGQNQMAHQVSNAPRRCRYAVPGPKCFSHSRRRSS